jgi:tetratricopeptide (TPR) repeat protein
MKKMFMLMLVLAVYGVSMAQELPPDVEKVYKGAEKLKNKEEYKLAITEYKNVLRSVNHVPSMESIAEIAMELMRPPNYRMAYEYYDKAIQELENQQASASKKKEKENINEHIQLLTPKRNKAKSYVDDFEKAKDKKEDGNRLKEDMDDEGEE